MVDTEHDVSPQVIVNPASAHGWSSAGIRSYLRRMRPTLGLLTYGAGDPNNAAVWSGASDAARVGNANLVCFPGRPIRSQREFEAQANVLYDIVGSSNVDGLVIWLAALSHWTTFEELSLFIRKFQPLPLVTVGILIPGLPGVTVDNYGGMQAVVRHLIEVHQRKNIAFILGPAHQEEAKIRYLAYRDVLAEHGILLRPELVVQGDFKETGGAAAAEELLLRCGQTFDALVAASDNMALGAMKVLRARGIEVPGDVAVGGLNDELQGRYFTPPLTTSTLRFYEQAYSATEMLLSMLDGQTVADEVILPAQLIVRQSCGCPDPMVSRIMASKRYLGDAGALEELAAREGEFLRAIASELGTAVPEPTTRLARLLWSGFLREVTGTAPDAFLTALGDVLTESAAAGITLSVWQDVVTVLWREFGAIAHQSLGERLAERIWQQARVMVGETAQRVQAYRVLQTQEEARKLGRITQALSATVNLGELADVLVGTLPELDIPSCYLSLYEDPRAPTRQARLIVAYDRHGRVELPVVGLPFATSELVPSAMIDPERRYSMVVQPLYFRQDQLGFAIFEADAQREEVYQQLGEEISGALIRTRLMERNIALYHEAENARLMAEMARCEAEAGRELAEEANRLKSRFLATVSHELRTPLSLIVGTLDMLRREMAHFSFPLPKVFTQDLASIDISAQHLTRLINDVLDLASGQAGELRLACEPLQLQDVLVKVAALAEPMVREKKLIWQVDFPQELPIVWADRTRIQQVILNLISNAVKFTESGVITLWAETGKKHVMVAVSDTGMGVSPSEQEFIFDEFRQTERSFKRGYGGMGLGLAISKRLVELHGGQIGVLSSGTEGAGSTFYFTLPIMAQVVTGLSKPNDRVRKVLLITEHPETSVRLGDYLSRRGFEIEILATAQNDNWLSQILASPPGALVIDYQLATKSGWDILRTLKQHLATSELPLLFYNLSPEQETGTLLELDYLSKPVDQRRLISALMRHGLHPDASKKHVILIVDDDPAVLNLHTRMVRASLPGCRILQATDGAEAIQRMAITRPDLVLLDLMMPMMDGFTVLERIRSSPQTASIPVIVLTAQILTTQDMARLQQGVTAVLSKEVFTAEEVLAQIETALGRKKRLGSEAQRLVRLTMAYIHEHYAENLSRSDLAAALSINERYLTRCFHDETGLTPFDYLLRYRLRRACQMLEDDSTSITDIALATGFSDASHFCRKFQKELGMSPSAYRRAHRASLEK